MLTHKILATVSSQNIFTGEFTTMSLIQILQPLFLFFIPFAVTVMLIPFITSLAKKYHIMDHPDHHQESVSRKVHASPTPRLGGIAMFTGFSSITLLFFHDNPYYWFIFSSALVFFLGLYDDFKNIPARIRLVFQIIIGGLTVYWGHLELSNLYLTPDWSLQLPYWAGFLVSVFFIVGAINASNMIDGLDGLAGGIILIAIILLCYVFIATFKDYSTLLYVGLPITGAILGFLKYNTHPASIFMGDGGSNWLGYFTGVLMLITAEKTGASGQAVPLIVVILCFAIPVLDTFFVLVRRLIKGINPALADQSHMHHGLLKLGLNQLQTVTFMYFVSAVIGIIGIFPLVFPKYLGWYAPYIVPALFLFLLYYILKKEKSLPAKAPLYTTLLNLNSKYDSRKTPFFVTAWERFNRFILYFITIGTPIITGGIDNLYIGYVSGFVLVVLVILLFVKIKGTGTDFVYSFILSFGVLLLLISNNTKQISVVILGEKYSMMAIYNIIFILLTISILLYILFTFQKKYLLITPTDFLAIVFPLALILMPNSFSLKWNLNVIAIRSIIFFVAIRVMIKTHPDFLNRIQLIIIISLAFLFLTGALGMRFV